MESLADHQVGPYTDSSIASEIGKHIFLVGVGCIEASLVSYATKIADRLVLASREIGKHTLLLLADAARHRLSLTSWRSEGQWERPRFLHHKMRTTEASD